MDGVKPYEYKVPLGVHDARLQEPAARELQEFVYGPKIERHKPMFGAVVRYGLAHVVMLAETGVVGRADATALLGALRDIERVGVEGFRLDLEAQDIAPNVEAILIDRLGEAIGGKILTGRSRADAQYTPDRMTLRDRTLGGLEAIVGCLRVLLDRAGQHVETVMPTYTFIQSAQPGTFGHYLMSYAEALATDVERLAAAYERLCLSPAEIGIQVGTTYPIDRERVAELLGFDGVLGNTRRALSSTDIELETVGAFTIACCHLARLAEDLGVWSSQEFGMVELADRYCSSSFLMPQKKNPKALDTPKLVAIAAQGNLTTMFNLFRLTPVAHPQDAVSASLLACETVEQIRRAFVLMEGVVESLAVHGERMRALTAAYFAQATDIADALVRERGLSFRAAHRVVGTAVRRALADGETPQTFGIRRLDEAAREVIGRETGLSEARLASLLDVSEGVRERDVTGGPAPQRVAAAIAAERGRLPEVERWLGDRRRRLDDARRRLDAAVDAYVA